jgi:hypothetical protein
MKFWPPRRAATADCGRAELIRSLNADSAEELTTDEHSSTLMKVKPSYEQISPLTFSTNCTTCSGPIPISVHQ